MASDVNKLWDTFENSSDDYEKWECSLDLVDKYLSYIRELKMIYNNKEDEIICQSDHLGLPLDSFYYKLGCVQFHIGKIQESTGSFRSATRLNPKFYEAHVFLAQTLRLRNDWKNAIITYDSILKKFPQKFKRKSQKDQLSDLKSRRFITDLSHLESKSLLYQITDGSSKIKPLPYSDLAEMLYWRGFCYLEAAETEQALQDFQAITKMDVSHRLSDAWAGLAQISGIFSKWKQNVEMANYALEIDPYNLRALDIRSTALMAIGENEKAFENNKLFSVIVHNKLYNTANHSKWLVELEKYMSSETMENGELELNQNAAFSKENNASEGVIENMENEISNENMENEISSENEENIIPNEKSFRDQYYENFSVMIKKSSDDD